MHNLNNIYALIMSAVLRYKSFFVDFTEVFGVSTFMGSFIISAIEFLSVGEISPHLLITSVAGAVVVMVGAYVKYVEMKMKKEKHDAEMREINRKYEEDKKKK